MKETDPITEGIREMLFGTFRPDRVLQRYQHGDKELCHRLWQIPESPAAYLEYHVSPGKRFERYLNDESRNTWLDAFYFLSDNSPESFHILCSFYRVLIHCECRMFIQAVEWKLNHLEITLLKYELVTFQNQVIEYIKECSFRLSSGMPASDKIEDRLDHFLLERLYYCLLMTLFELQGRYKHIFGERIITRDELYLKHLERPVPVSAGFHRTTAFTEFELERMLRPPVQISTIEKTLREVRNDYAGCEDKESKSGLLPSVHILENVWLCFFIKAVHGDEPVAGMSDIKENRLSILRWREIICESESDTEKGDEMDEIQLIINRMSEIKQVFNEKLSASSSEAMKLIAEIQTLFEPDSGNGGLVDGSKNRLELDREQTDGKHWLLDQYISLDLIETKMGVTKKSLRSYIRASGVSVIEITAKNRWMHVDDFKAFMEKYRTKM